MGLSEVIGEVEWRLLADQPSRTSSTGKRNLAILHAMYFADLGLSEVCDLSPWDLNSSARAICRSNRPRRTTELAPVPAETWSALEAWAEVRPRSPYFFSTLSGNRLKEEYIRAFVRRYADRSGVTKPTRAVAVPVARAPGLALGSYGARLLDRAPADRKIGRRLTTAHLSKAVSRRLR